MHAQPIKRVGFYGDAGPQPYFKLLQTVAWENEVELVPFGERVNVSLAGILICQAPGSRPQLEDLPAHLPSFTIVLISSGELKRNVKFSNSKAISSFLRGRCLDAASVDSTKQTVEKSEVLAQADGSSVWTTKIEAGVRHDINYQSVPWLSGDERLFMHLRGDSLMRLLPLIDWFRSLSGWDQWNKPPARACFMFDDPNLHAKSYGYISFSGLAAEGRRHGYHTSFATVPLDYYYTSRSAAKVFKENREVLSLLAHGNDHVHRELEGREPAAQQLSRMRQALSRIQWIERRSGVPVARVMAPPHGTFGASVMNACAISGFEAACVSWGAVWAINRHMERLRLLGAGPAEFVEGLPIIPRFRLSGGIENDIFLAVYLGQPVIPVGHHWDLAGGVDLLRALSAYINGLGDVRWMNLTDMARSNFWWCVDGSTLFIRSFSKRFEITVPEGVRNILIEFPWQESDMSVHVQLTGERDKILKCDKVENQTWAFSVEKPGRVGVRVESLFTGVDQIPESFRFRWNALGRRILTEARDRLMPFPPHRFRRQ